MRCLEHSFCRPTATGLNRRTFICRGFIQMHLGTICSGPEGYISKLWESGLVSPFFSYGQYFEPCHFSILISAHILQGRKTQTLVVYLCRATSEHEINLRLTRNCSGSVSTRLGMTKVSVDFKINRMLELFSESVHGPVFSFEPLGLMGKVDSLC